VLVIVVVAIKLFGVNEVAADAVGLAEHLKTFVADGETKVKEWMQNDTKAQAAIDKVKAKLRL